MNLKKTILGIAATMMSTASFGQFGITAGYSSSRIVDENRNAISAFNVGVKGEGKIGLGSDTLSHAFAEGSLLLAQKGYGYKPQFVIGETTKEADRLNLRLYYLHLPAYLGYDFKVAPGFVIGPKVGVYVSYGLWGDDGDFDPFKDYDNKYEWDNMDRFDFGVCAGLNVNVMRHYQFSATYEWGQKQLARDRAEDRLRVFSVNLAYLF